MSPIWGRHNEKHFYGENIPMLQSTSRKLTVYLICNHIIDPAMSEVYQYGLELTLSTLFTSSAIMLIAYVRDSLLYGLLYFAVSVPLRMTAGGYHAPTYFRCFLISNGTYLAVSMLSESLSSLSLPHSFWLALLFCSACYIAANCPVRNLHHLVSASVLKKNRQIAIFLLCALCYLILLLYFMLQRSYLLNFMIITISSVAIFILPAKRKEEQGT